MNVPALHQIFPQVTEQRVMQSVNTGEKFIEQYYRFFPRGSAGKYYQETSKVIWNGTAMTGGQFKQQYLPQLQNTMTYFDVHGLDCQSLGEDRTLVVASGLVKMDQKKVQFSQTFVLEKSGTLTYIVSDCFRLV